MIGRNGGMNTLKPCGECTACCEGFAESNIFGNVMRNGKKCVFLVDEKCCIYKDRPEVCIKFQCAWSQGIISDDLRPDKSGILAYVKNLENNDQEIIAIEMKNDVKFSDHLKLINDVKKLNTNLNLIYYKDNKNKDFFKPKHKIFNLKREV